MDILDEIEMLETYTDAEDDKDSEAYWRACVRLFALYSRLEEREGTNDELQ